MINFLTSNKKKAEDFKVFGFGVKEFTQEIPEIKSMDVEEVALYKAKDVLQNNIVVEDTSLYVEGAHFWGTDIKHVYEEIQDDSKYNGHKAIWKIALCLKKDENYYLSCGELHGILVYPAAKEGYHFEKFFQVENNNEKIHYSLLSDEDKYKLSPRMQALKKMHDAINNNDYSKLICLPESTVKEWDGEYQVEKKKNKIKP